MPRTNNGSELPRYLNSVKKGIYSTGTFGSTVTTGPIVAGDVSADITATTNFANGDFVIINGDGGVELTKISGTPATTDCPVDRPLYTAQSTGATFIEATVFSLGHVDKAGAKIGGSATLTPIEAATSRVPIAYFSDTAKLSFEIPLLGFNNLNLQAAFGITEGESGSGTSSAPYAILINGSNVGNQGVQVFRLAGVTKGGGNYELDILDATIEVAVDYTLGTPTPGSIVLKGMCTSFISRIW